MSIPQRPHDIQLANIIDKMAEFVARNGPEFESAMIARQKDNNKFQFLQNNSEFNPYYQFRVAKNKHEYRSMDDRRSLQGKSTSNDPPRVTNSRAFSYSSATSK